MLEVQELLELRLSQGKRAAAERRRPAPYTADATVVQCQQVAAAPEFGGQCMDLTEACNRSHLCLRSRGQCRRLPVKGRGERGHAPPAAAAAFQQREGAGGWGAWAAARRGGAER